MVVTNNSNCPFHQQNTKQNLYGEWGHLFYSKICPHMFYGYSNFMLFPSEL